MSLHDILTESVANWEVLGHPALLERFVLRNGKAYAPAKRKGRKRKAKQCFANATGRMLEEGSTYVEGFAIRKDFPLPLLHAWVTITGDDATDPTLDAMDFEYYGVSFSRATVTAEIVRNRCYGLLDTGLINTRLIFQIDPELEEICKQVQHNRRRA
jgi:hypothetical protein